MTAKRETRRAAAGTNRKVGNLRPKAVSANQARSVKGGASAGGAPVHGGWDTLANKKF